MSYSPIVEDISRKRSSSCLQDQAQDDRAKRLRVSSPESDYDYYAFDADSGPGAMRIPTSEDLGRDGLRRSIALTLQHVGFDSASPEAMESFTAAAETYMERLIGQLKRTAQASRRTDPTPADYETVLRRHNLPISSLKPHLKNPIPKEKLEPKYYNPFTEYLHTIESTTSTDFLGPELDGTLDKEARPWIATNLPPFPSKHTYRHTAAEAQEDPDREQKRAGAATDMRKAGEALRRIDRALNASRHQELRQLARRDAQALRRHQALEELMKEALERDGRQVTPDQIADRTLVVNAEVMHHRQEVPRAAR